MAGGSSISVENKVVSIVKMQLFFTEKACPFIRTRKCCTLCDETHTVRTENKEIWR